MAASPTLVQGSAQPVEALPAAEGTRLLYERYYDRIFGYCLYQLGNREEAEDAAQTTFLWAFRGLRRGVVPRAEDSWLFTIAKNACRTGHRTRGRRRQREVVSDPQLLADVASAPSRQHDELIGLEEALARMPEQQRRAILLREWQGLSYREIAAELEITGAAVETLIFRARRSLAELLDGKPAPKRARVFALDLGAIGAALKSALGGASAKLAAGAAAAVVMTTTLAGAAEERPARPFAPQPSPVAAPHAPPAGEPVAAEPRPELRLGSKDAKRPGKDRPKPPGRADETATAPSPTEQSPVAAVGGKVEDAILSLPLGSTVSDVVPVEQATALVDATVADLGETVEDATDLLP